MDGSDRPSAVPAPLWRWVCIELGERGARSVDPLVAVVLAAARVAERGETMPPEVLRYWAWHLDSARRTVHQSERGFLTLARAAGWSDDEIRRWALLERDADVDEHIAGLNALVRRVERPPPPDRSDPASAT